MNDCSISILSTLVFSTIENLFVTISSVTLCTPSRSHASSLFFYTSHIQLLPVATPAAKQAGPSFVVCKYSEAKPRHQGFHFLHAHKCAPRPETSPILIFASSTYSIMDFYLIGVERLLVVPSPPRPKLGHGQSVIGHDLVRFGKELRIDPVLETAREYPLHISSEFNCCTIATFIVRGELLLKLK